MDAMCIGQVTYFLAIRTAAAYTGAEAPLAAIRNY